MSARWRAAALAVPIAISIVLGLPWLVVLTTCFAYWAIVSKFPS